MSDQNWPNEPFEAKHVSGVQVRVTPAGLEASNLPGPPVAEHWYEAEQRKKAKLIERALGPLAKDVDGRAFPTAAILDALLTRLEAVEAKLADLQAK